MTHHEVKLATFQLGAHKAQGPDRLPACFFQCFWNVIGDSLVDFVQKVFCTGTVPKEANQSIICLIPKQEHPENISQFRLICLNNVIVKVVIKLIADRVKQFIGDLTGS